MQIAFVRAHLHGETALAWALGEGKLADRMHGSWEEFIARFQATWGDADAMCMAGIKLQSLKMPATADKYIATFQVLVDKTGYNEAALINFFQHGLTTPLAKLIYTCSGRPPTNLQGWKDAVSTTGCFECAWAQHNHEVQQNRTFCTPPAVLGSDPFEFADGPGCELTHASPYHLLHLQ
jgi:hypothetical protein